MPIRRRFKLGDHLVVCDRTGFTRYASEMRREWDGLLVWKRVLFSRHPQDLIRGLPDDARVENARPRGIPQFVGPLTTELTANASAGATTISVTSSARFAPGDSVLIGLDNRDMFRTTIATVPGPTSLQITTPLPWSVSIGSAVIDTSAVARTDITG